MTEPASALDFLRDPRISVHATAALPAWLFSADGGTIHWANPAGADLLGTDSPAALGGSVLDSGHPLRTQLAQLAGLMTPGAPPRLARLRGFSVGLGRLLTCAVAPVALPSGHNAVLVTAVESAGTELPIEERLRRLLVGCGEPAALFSADGKLLHATPSAQSHLGAAETLAQLGGDALAARALAAGHAQSAALAIDRLGADETAVLLVRFSPVTAQTARQSAPFAEQPTPSQAVSASVPEAQQPVRFLWQTDAESRFTLLTGDFSEALGPRTTTALGRPWGEIAAALGLDAEGRIARAMADRQTFSAVVTAWPVDESDERITVELSGFPQFDAARRYMGHRGFGLCREAARLAELAARRRTHMTRPLTVAAPTGPEPAAAASPEPEVVQAAQQPTERASASAKSLPENVVPFPASEKAPSLSPMETRAFQEIARELTSRLGILGAPPVAPEAAPSAEPAAEWTAEPRRPADPSAQPDILDRLPVAVLIYRGNRLIYANRAFLDWSGYDDLAALARAGGLERLFAAPDAAPDLDTLPEASGRIFAISARDGEQVPVEGRLFALPWEGESALALVLMRAAADDRQKAAELALRRAESETRELLSILDTATDGVIVLDREGHILTGNRSAEALFGYDTHELTQLSFAELFAPESQRTALDYLDGLVRAGVASVLNDGREVIGRVREGGLIPLFMTMGRIGESGEKLCAVFRDITQWKKAEEELINARREAEKASSAKSDFLAKISHEIRTPLNSIIGFSEVMIEERFGPIGNERYKQYLKDIKASGAHVVSLLNDLLDLSKIEAGKMELNFTRVELNSEVQQCVALMQPQANRERIIIRTSLAPHLPPIVADARSIRQIVLNLLSNSIKFTRAGGQVIVSTALTEQGEVILRIRDTGIGMSAEDIAIALEPFRQLETAARAGLSGTGLGLPLTKALAEANRASFSITSRPNAGTLVEISFPSTRVLAE
ncbi:MAG TPA: ATP-binding protein [Xanthobacteraceae bacterium]|nr:ATP-binding protein [Xanthobacteraceae bacterium]